MRPFNAVYHDNAAKILASQAVKPRDMRSVWPRGHASEIAQIRIRRRAVRRTATGAPHKETDVSLLSVVFILTPETNRK